MSNIIPLNLDIPAHLASRIGVPSVLGESIGGGLSSGVEYPRISIKASRFRIVTGNTETVLSDPTLEVVVVGANPGISKAFYADAWNPDADAKAPDCFTLEGIRPDPSSKMPQNDLCATCPQNAWGSKKTDTGKDLKACADKKRLAVVAVVDPTGPIYLLEVTPAALTGLNKYNRELATRGIAPEIVKTIISFDTDASFPKLQFGFGGFIDAPTQIAVDKLHDTPEVLEITGAKSETELKALAAPVVETVEAAPAAPVETVEAAAPVAFGSPAPETVAAVAEVVGEPAAATVTEPVAFGSPAPETVAAVAEVVPEPVAETAAPVATFGQAPAKKVAEKTPTVTAVPAAVSEVVTEEPESAPIANTTGLADEITALMAEVADDASS